MFATGAIFLDFNLPNATTWFYLSLLLAVALFFKFSRLLSVRNWDVLTLFALVPGFLLLRESHGQSWVGYLWLVCGSGYFLGRCFFDLALVRRPALAPNLNLGGLAWLGGALFICLIAVAARLPGETREELRTPAPIERIQQQSERVVTNQTGAAEVPGFDAAFWVSRGLAMLCHLAVCAGLVYIGCRHFRHGHMGMAAATFYLLLPYTAFDIGRWHHVWPLALMVWAIALYRRPMLAGLLLGVASATAYFPVVAFPVWLSFYWRRGAGRFAAAFGLTAGICLAVVALLLWTDDELARSFQTALALPDWQPWREPISGTQGLWQGIHWAYRMPVFIAYLAMMATTAFWPSPKNLAHVVALTAANIIGIQFWYADQGGTYALWYLPLLLLLVFRPNLSDRQPAAILAETDWLMRSLRALGRLTLRLLRPTPPQPQPAGRAP